MNVPLLHIHYTFVIPIKWTLHQFISPFIEIISGGYGQLAALKNLQP